MKFIGLGLIFLGTLGFNSVWANDQTELELSPNVLSCTRSIVEQGIGKTSGLLFVGQLLESEIKGDQLLSHCKSFLLSSEADSNIDRANYSNFISKLSLNKKTKKLLNNFNKPFYECRFKKIEAPISKGFGINSSLGAAKCVGSNRRAYIILLDQKSYGLDFISKVFSQNIYIDKSNKLLDLDLGAKAYAIGEYLAEVLDTDLELDEIGTRALSKETQSRSSELSIRYKAISIEQV
jgi:hypothetical protein